MRGLKGSFRDLMHNTTATTMSKTMAVHKHYNFRSISLASSAKEQRKKTKFWVVWRT